MTITECNACKSRIFFAPTVAGKSVPLDAEPAEKGNYWINANGVAHCLKKGETTDQPRYISHYATCTDPGRFRKKGA